MKKDLEIQNQTKLDEMEKNQEEFEQDLAKQKASLNGLGDLEKQLKAREDRRAMFDEKEKSKKDDRARAADEINKMREEMDKEVDAIQKGLAEEKLATMERLDDRIKARRKNREQARKQQEEEEEEKAKEAEADKAKEIERIKELRVRKQELEKTLTMGQKLIYKQCYSRPLYKFNAHLQEITDKEGDYSFLNKGVKPEFKKQIVSKLLEKVTLLEGKVTEDVNSHLYSARGARGEDFSDT